MTRATRALPKVAPTCALWTLPALALMLAAGPAMLVRLKTAGAAAPGTVAVTLYAPASVFAVAPTLALPLASVLTVVAPSVAPGPLVGPVKVTGALGTGLPLLSL